MFRKNIQLSVVLFFYPHVRKISEEFDTQPQVNILSRRLYSAGGEIQNFLIT